MKFVNFKSLFKLFICVVMSFSFFACAEGDIKNSLGKSKLEECLAKATKFEHMKSKNEAEMWTYLQKSQDYYLCAEKEGDTYAGYKAAGFSEAGVANKLEAEEIIRLYTNSANEGNPHAAYALSVIECGNDYKVCTNPQAAKKWLIKAAAAGNANALNSLGIFYKRGYEGTVDINRAAACYKLAAQKGSELGKSNLDELIKNGNQLVPIDCL